MITAIDKNTALILIDLQKGILQGEKAHPVENIVAKAAELIEAFHEEGLPVVIVNVNPAGAKWTQSRKDSSAAQKTASAALTMPDFDRILEELPTKPDDIFVTKHTWSAFYNTALQEELEKRSVTGIVIGGISTSAGVEGTARAASERGYNISFATDAMTDANPEAHEASLKNIFPRLGETGTTEEIIAKLGSRI